MDIISEDLSLDGVIILRTVIEGATVVVARPRGKVWNSCLLVHAHGFRPERTELRATIDDPFWIRLIEQGWAVAVTSYRRSGLIVGDAIKDIFNARNFVCCEFGIPAFTFLDGRSMGGAISVRIAERPNIGSMFQGVLAIGAALLVKPETEELALTYRPTIPILFLTNTSEVGPIESYLSHVQSLASVELSRRAGGEEIVVPALHFVAREGHNWTNASERWRAFSTLVEWRFVGSLVTHFRFDGTNHVQVESTATSDGTRLHGHVIAASDVDTDTLTSFTLQDLFSLNIHFQSRFIIESSQSVQLNVILSSYPFVGVGDDEIVATEDPRGHILLFEMANFRNQFGDRLSGLYKNGDELLLYPATKPPPRKLSARQLSMLQNNVLLKHKPT